MNSKNFRNRIEGLRVWSREGERPAPHKPLLLLLAMGNLCRGKPRLLPYKDIAVPLHGLLKRFGPPRVYQPQQPFYRLPRNGLWELHGDVPPKTANGAPSHRTLLESNVSAGFPYAVYKLLQKSPETLWIGVQILLDSHFTQSLHDDLISEVGIHRTTQSVLRSARRRNPEFRREVLKAYDNRCAVCGYDIRLNGNLLGLEAAHIKWHAHDGPDKVSNGLALCILHHKGFDSGGITLLDDLRLLVSKGFHSQNQVFDMWFLDYHGKPIRAPMHDEQRPDPSYLHWHRKQVFKGPLMSARKTLNNHEESDGY